MLVGDLCLHLEVDSQLRLFGTYNVVHFALQSSLVFLVESNFRSDSSNNDTRPYYAHDPYGNGNTYSYFSPLDYIGLDHLRMGSFFTYIKILLGGITNGVNFRKCPMLSFGRLCASLPSFYDLDDLHFPFPSLTFS